MADPIGKTRELFLFWDDNLIICKIEKSEFSIEVEVEGKDFEGRWWVIFVYLSHENHKRRSQWKELKVRRRGCQKWIIGGDFNDILGPKDKRGGRKGTESSFWPFRNFVRNMEMEEVTFKGKRWAWANNRVGEGFIE